MRFSELVQGRFIRRLNRFAALVDLGGEETLVHVANSGRMRELLVEGRRVFLRPVARAHRKTAFDLALVDPGGGLASADARLPNLLLYEALREGRLPQFAGYDELFREITFGESRLDLGLAGPAGRCYIEAKSVTLVVDGVGLFPDAPTIRGRKHVGSLSDAVREGHRAAVAFVVQREDAHALTPNDTADPQFGIALRQAAREGVEVYAYRCRVDTDRIVLAGQVPVML